MKQGARELSRAFAKRMLPLALLAGAVVLVVPPLTYRVLAWRGLSKQAQTYATQIATRLAEVVHEQPRLWRYNAAKVLRATLPLREQGDVAAIEIVDCHRRQVFSSVAAASEASNSARGPRGVASVRVHGRLAAFVVVRIDPARPWRLLGLLLLVCGPLGLAVGGALFVFPSRVVRDQGARLAAALAQVTEAQAALERSNSELEGRVAEGVAEVRRLSARLLETQEEERRRIARDLHDGLGQAIAGVQMELELARSRPEEQRARLDGAVAQLADTLVELRRVVRELRPPELAAADLPRALAATCEVFERRSGVTTYYRDEGMDEAGEIVDAAAVCLLRVLQQALTNISQHAEATEIAVRFEASSRGLVLEVEDDGRGFDIAAAEASGGSGLRGMRERLELLEGSFRLRSSPGDGTQLRFRIPPSAAWREDTP